MHKHYKTKIKLYYNTDKTNTTEDQKNMIDGIYNFQNEKQNMTIEELYELICHKFCCNSKHANRIFNYMIKGWFSPSTTVIRYATDHDKYPISCFTNTSSKLSSRSEIKSLIGLTSAQTVGGGGLSIDISNVPEKSNPNKGKISTGPIKIIVSLESVFNIMANDRKRQAVRVYYMDADHPDIIEFINLKKAGFDLYKTALSNNCFTGINVNDEFLQAIKQNEDIELEGRGEKLTREKINAKSLWIKLINSRLDLGEPFVFNESFTNRKKPFVYKLLGIHIKCTNLCTEVVVPNTIDFRNKERSGVCNLASLNLELIDEILGDEEFFEDVILFMDGVANEFINRAVYEDDLSRCVYCMGRARTLGLGVYGLHYYFQKKNIAFESKEALDLNNEIFKKIFERSRKASYYIGKKLGHCPDNSDAGFMGRTTTNIAIAPTIHTSRINKSSPGINPIYSNYYVRKGSSGTEMVRNKYLVTLIQKKFPNDLHMQEEVWGKIREAHGSIQPVDCFTEHEKRVYRTAFEINQIVHVQMSCERQKYICQGQSFNLFFSKETPKSIISIIHFKAISGGLKTLYYCFSSPAIQSDNKCSSCTL